MNHRLIDYLHQPLRHHLVFTSSDVEGLQYVDVGYELACMLQAGGDQEITSIVADFQKLILKKVESHTLFGKILAIANISMLYEPELHINFHALFEQWSKSMCLIVRLDDTFDIHFFSDLNPLILDNTEAI